MREIRTSGSTGRGLETDSRGRLTGHPSWKRRKQPSRTLRSTAPALDPTWAGTSRTPHRRSYRGSRPEMGDDKVSRREFVALSVAAGLGASPPVVETDVEVETPDGTCDAVFFHPAKGSHPGVLVWHDSRGVRPAFREIGRR